MLHVLINIKAKKSQRDLIDKAAAVLNVSRSEFMIATACREAVDVLLDKRLFLVDDDTHQTFLKLIELPIEENLGLKDLLNNKSPWEK